MNTKTPLQALALGLLGAVVGGIVGYFLFIWIVRQGFYALMLPGAFLGWGAGLCARIRSVPLAIICTAAGLVLGIVAEWRSRPFIVDDSFTYFIAHLHDLRPFTLLMIALGAYFSYRFSVGRERSDVPV
jgi:hypothetical protein